MPTRLTRIVVAAAVTCVSIGLWHAVIAEDSPPQGQKVGAERIKPAWKVGQTWTVETKTRPVQLAAPIAKDQYADPVRSVFLVKSIERINDHDCYRVEIRDAAQADAEPTTIFWVDQQTLSLQRVDSRRQIQGQWRTLTQDYSSAGGKSVAVIGMANAIPIDLPSFNSDQAKTPAKYTATLSKGKGRKSGGVNLVSKIEQDVVSADPQRVNRMLGAAHKRSDTDSLVEVRLRSAARRVDQLWKPGSPWPEFSDNGVTVSVLLPSE